MEAEALRGTDGSVATAEVLCYRALQRLLILAFYRLQVLVPGCILNLVVHGLSSVGTVVALQVHRANDEHGETLVLTKLLSFPTTTRLPEKHSTYILSMRVHRWVGPLTTQSPQQSHQQLLGRRFQTFPDIPATACHSKTPETGTRGHSARTCSFPQPVARSFICCQMACTGSAILAVAAQSRSLQQDNCYCSAPVEPAQQSAIPAPC